ncbi:MAG: VOC family protein [Eubacteriaceae bacterium]|nr:VOC family protein [Eubacteriaceae bacterium]
MKMRISRIRLVTANLNSCLSFYRRLGFQVIEKSGKYMLLAKTFRIEVIVMGRQLPPTSKNPISGCLEMSIALDMPVRAFMARLKEQGLEPEHIRSDLAGAVESAFFRDPDGNLIEFVAQRQSSS